MIKLVPVHLAKTPFEALLSIGTQTLASTEESAKAATVNYTTASDIKSRALNKYGVNYQRNGIQIAIAGNQFRVQILYPKNYSQLLHDIAISTTLSQNYDNELRKLLSLPEACFQLRVNALNDQEILNTIEDFYAKNPEKKIEKYAKENNIPYEDIRQSIMRSAFVETSYFFDKDGKNAKLTRVCSIFEVNRVSLHQKNPLITYYSSETTKEDCELTRDTLDFILSEISK